MQVKAVYHCDLFPGIVRLRNNHPVLHLTGGQSFIELASAAHNFLQFSFSPNIEQRSQAEQGLRSMDQREGFLIALLTVVNRFSIPQIEFSFLQCQSSVFVRETTGCKALLRLLLRNQQRFID
jgi:hypothetical protein